MNMIADLWKEYAKTLPDSAPSAQIVEAKLGFYAGASSTFSRMMAKALDPKVSQEDGEQFLDNIAEEVRSFLALDGEEGLAEFYLKDIENAR